MEKKIVLTRMNQLIEESSLGSNEYILNDYWKVSYHGLVPIEHSRGEMNRYMEVINGINSTRQNEPKEIIIFF